MQRTLIILLLLIALYGCNMPQPNELKTTKDNSSYIFRDDVMVIEYDSCEYVRFEGGEDSWGGHKGNCKYCKQRNK